MAAQQNERVEDGLAAGASVSFTDVATALIGLPGFAYVHSAEYPTVGIEPDPRYASRLVFRQRVCDHLEIRAGRCLTGEGDVLLGEHTAKRLGLSAGDQIELASAVFNADPRDPRYVAEGVPKMLTVVGVYRTGDPNAAYWGTHGYFTTLAGLGPGEPVFTNSATLRAMDHGTTQLAIDGTAQPGTLDAGRLDELRAGLDRLRKTSTQLGTSLQISTELPRLLDRIEAGRASSRLLVPVLAVPLVLLACFCIFLAVGYSVQGRQSELAVVALRGPRWWVRWWLATGESLVAVGFGAVAGCVAGQLLVNALAANRFPGVGVDPGWSSLRYAPLAALAALIAALAAQRRPLLSPVTTLLRRNPVRGLRHPIFTDAIVVILAVVAGVQLSLSNGSLTGIGLFAPALLVLALALLAARALLPFVTRYAGRALTTDRLGVALAGLQLSRRPGAERLFALLVATVAVACYAAAGMDTAARARVVEAELGTGAARVLTVAPVYRTQLLQAVRRADPGGTFAMAAARMPSGSAGEPSGLAVDSERLAAVATWPDGAPDAGPVARGLRPAAAEPFVFRGEDITVVATAEDLPVGKGIRLSVAVASITGLGDAEVQLGELQPGRFSYQQRVAVCREGCRINGLGFTAVGTALGISARVVINELTTINPVRPVLVREELADPGKWRMPENGRLARDPGGLRIDLDASEGLSSGTWVHPGGTPYPLPVAHAGSLPPTGVVNGLDAGELAVTPVAELPAVPQLGRHAVLADLEYADRLAVDAGQAQIPQVWLNDSAPPDVLERLAEQGLTVLVDTRADQVRRSLEQQGPALALWFHLLAGGLAVLLGAGALVLAAAVDRSRRVADLAALRAQGLSRGAVDRATLWTYPVLVLFAAVTGLAVAVAAWELTGWALPLAGLDPPDLPLPTRPGAAPMLGAAAAVLAVLFLVALATGRNLRSRVNRLSTVVHRGPRETG
ncbi:FtsX-like permease family protein [Actinoplanes sp. NPDC024001]|uniref:FtsX-like permease family protein n=1 Tax=Actinoplanes sp. NPDC024001 TaxID=3154598 RepID=UPI00340F2E6D